MWYKAKQTRISCTERVDACSRFAFLSDHYAHSRTLQRISRWTPHILNIEVYFCYFCEV